MKTTAYVKSTGLPLWKEVTLNVTDVPGGSAEKFHPDLEEWLTGSNSVDICLAVSPAGVTQR